MVPLLGVIQASRENSGGSRENQRRHGRLRAHSVHCSFGTVVDISASGLRVTTTKGLRPGQERIVEIHTLDGPFAARVRVAWTRKAGMLSKQAGLEFIELCPRARGILNALARSAGSGE